MRSGNAGNEWRPKLGYARLQLRLKERAPESIIFRESWPGERFQNFIFLFFTQDLQRIILSCEWFITLFTMLRKDNYVYNERNFFRKISVAFLHQHFIFRTLLNSHRGVKQKQKGKRGMRQQLSLLIRGSLRNRFLTVSLPPPPPRSHENRLFHRRPRGRHFISCARVVRAIHKYKNIGT